ncbi:bifunctional DNA primase/polymerase [Tateyamaria sp.]|nr:bifunctional DNA primase/polymerase [Tateyamaria sp.]
MNDNIFANTAPAYYARGIPVIPLYSREKRPVPTGWSEYHNKPVEQSQQGDWIHQCATGNIGVVLGSQSGICVLDIDCEDEGLIQLIRSLIPQSPWVRIGQKGMVLAFKYSGHKTFRIKSATGESICELLSERTQVVLPPSIHPKTQMPYVANCDLIDVIDQLPVLDQQVEQILRGAIQDVGGVDLSISGSSRLTDFVSSGSRDTSLTEKAGLFAYAVMRGERTLKEAIGMLQSFNTEFIEQVAGDAPEVDNHVDNLIRFLHRDVHEKCKPLPEGWDADMSLEEKEALGLHFDKDDEEWTYEEMRDYLQGEFERHPPESKGRFSAVEKILNRVARSSNLSSLEEGRLMQYIADVSQIGVRAPELKKQVRELRMGDIQGTDHSEIAQEVLKDLQQVNEIRRHGSGLWRYMGSHWEELSLEHVMARIAKDYGHLQAARKHSDHKGIYATLLNIVVQGIKTVEMKGVNFANGFLDEQLVLREHNSDYGMTYTLPFRYLPEMAGNSPLFLNFLEDCWGHDDDYADKMSALQEALAVTLFGMGSRYQRVVLCQGVPKSGKSQLLKVASSLVPDNAKCVVPPNDWADKFLPTMMHEKLINVCGELSEKKKIDGQRFKDIVDGAEMAGQLKGGQIFQFRPICTHWFASNHTPKTEDTSDGFNRRWLIIEFNKPVPPEKRRTDLGDTIVAEEREAIVAWAVLALPRLIQNQEYTLPPSHKQLLREVAQENNSVRFFMQESPAVKIVSDSSDKLLNRTLETKLFKEYWSFCFGAGGVKPVGSRVFRARMREMQSEMNYRLSFETNPMGVQEAFYDFVTVVNVPTT